MSHYRVTYTAYLPEPKVSRHRSTDPESVRRCRELDTYSKRLDKQNYKLENLDDVCLSNLDKCNRYYNNSQVRESRLSKSLRDSKRMLRSQSTSLNAAADSIGNYHSSRSAAKLIAKYAK